MGLNPAAKKNEKTDTHASSGAEDNTRSNAEQHRVTKNADGKNQ